jgi:type I restriction enzyme S subunit
MKGWREYSLEQFAVLVKDIYKPNGKDDQKYIGLEHIEQETLRLNSVGNSTDVISNKFLFQANDILFGKLRPYFRKVIKPKFSGICSTDIWVLRAKEGFSQEFLFYFIANWDFVDIASSGEGGTRMPRADWDFLCKTRWLLPPLPEQKAIAAVLSSLDDKIDLLHRQNKTLEAMAETLFRQWFVEPCKNGLPEGWREGKLGDVVTVVSGSTPKTEKPEYWDGEYHWTSPRDITNLNGLFLFDTERKITKLGLEQIGSGLLPRGTLLMSSRAPVGALAFAEIPLAINQGYAGIICDKGFSREFVYLWLKTNMDYVRSYANGSTFQEISKSTFRELEFTIPENKSYQKFQDLVISKFTKMKMNSIQIRTLTALRELLLPKLISGEVRVKV